MPSAKNTKAVRLNEFLIDEVKDLSLRSQLTESPFTIKDYIEKALKHELAKESNEEPEVGKDGLSAMQAYILYLVCNISPLGQAEDADFGEWDGSLECKWIVEGGGSDDPAIFGAVWQPRILALTGGLKRVHLWWLNIPVFPDSGTKGYSFTYDARKVTNPLETFQATLAHLESIFK